VERVAATARTVELRSIAQAITAALPATVVEVVLTGSVSRGVADEVSDIEMLLVAEEELDLDNCFSFAASCGLTSLGTWGQQSGPTKRVSGYCEGEPIELIWWSLANAEAAIDASSPAISPGLPTRSHMALPYGHRGCWRGGRSAFTTIPTNSRTVELRTLLSSGAGSMPQVC
jgi:hypothetical protein